MRDPEFRVSVSEERADVAYGLRGRLLDSAVEAVEVLRELAGPGQSGQVRLGAARALLTATTLRNDLISSRELDSAVELVVETAINYVPLERRGVFLEDLARRADR